MVIQMDTDVIEFTCESHAKEIIRHSKFIILTYYLSYPNAGHRPRSRSALQ